MISSPFEIFIISQNIKGVCEHQENQFSTKTAIYGLSHIVFLLITLVATSLTSGIASVAVTNSRVRGEAPKIVVASSWAAAVVVSIRHTVVREVAGLCVHVSLWRLFIPSLARVTVCGNIQCTRVSLCIYL